jgi:hypothetical protein
MGLNLTLLSFIVCIKLKCNKRHIYGLNSDLRIQKAIRKKKQQLHQGKATVAVEPRPQLEPEFESQVNQSL